MRTVTANERTALNLGYQGENEAQMVIFDVAGWGELYGDGVFQLIAKLPGKDMIFYPCIIDVTDDEKVTWVVKAADTQRPGYGEVQISYIVDGAIAKSILFKTSIMPSAIGNFPPMPPQKDWVDKVLESGTKADFDATKAESYAVGGTGTREGEDEDNAKYYSDLAAKAVGDPSMINFYIDNEGLLHMVKTISED